MKSRLSRFVDPTRYPSEYEKSERAKAFCKWTCDLTFYTISIVYSFIFFRNENYIPSCFVFGRGTCRSLLHDYPAIPESSRLPMRVILGFQLGKHLYSLCFQIAYNSEEKKFCEFLLHHLLALLLIAFSYVFNFWLLAVFVLLLHDSSDLTLIAARWLSDLKTRPFWLLYPSYALAVGNWIYTRFLILLFCVVKTSLWSIPDILINRTDFDIKRILSYPAALMILMLLGLVIMNCYWIRFIIQALLSVFIKKKVKIDYDENDAKGKKDITLWK